jgi:hypothetical protein
VFLVVFAVVLIGFAMCLPIWEGGPSLGGLLVARIRGCGMAVPGRTARARPPNNEPARETGWVSPTPRSSSATRIRIVALPPGEAPAHIRAAWVGLELPTLWGGDVPCSLPVVGAISGQGQSVVVGYAVSGRAAVELLARHAPAAAAWWRANAPDVLRDDFPLVFPADVCRKAA